MSCEFSETSVDGQTVVCRKGLVLQEIISLNDLKGVFTPVQLKAEICDNPNPEARDQCHAHADLVANGRGSIYCK